MKPKPTHILAALLILALVFPAFGQNEKKPLTNTEIVEMVKGGLAENVIVAAIQSAPANYDTSPAALIELNKKGVTAKVQEAMLAAQKSAQTPSNPPAPTGVPGHPSGVPVMRMHNTVAYVDGTNRVDMKQSQGKVDTTSRFVYVEIKTVFQGKAATFRVKTNSPVFEVALMSNFEASDWIILIKPKAKKESREIFIGGAAPFTQIKPDQKKDTVPLTHEEARKETTPGMPITVYRVKPKAPLPAGEYILSVHGAYYCFGVDAAK